MDCFSEVSAHATRADLQSRHTHGCVQVKLAANGWIFRAHAVLSAQKMAKKGMMFCEVELVRYVPLTMVELKMSSVSRCGGYGRECRQPRTPSPAVSRAVFVVAVDIHPF